MRAPTCRVCAAVLQHAFVDLGATPLCESYISAERYGEAEPVYALRAGAAGAAMSGGAQRRSRGDTPP